MGTERQRKEGEGKETILLEMVVDFHFLFDFLKLICGEGAFGGLIFCISLSIGAIREERWAAIYLLSFSRCGRQTGDLCV